MESSEDVFVNIDLSSGDAQVQIEAKPQETKGAVAKELYKEDITAPAKEKVRLDAKNERALSAPKHEAGNAQSLNHSEENGIGGCVAVDPLRIGLETTGAVEKAQRDSIPVHGGGASTELDDQMPVTKIELVDVPLSDDTDSGSEEGDTERGANGELLEVQTEGMAGRGLEELGHVRSPSLQSRENGVQLPVEIDEEPKDSQAVEAVTQALQEAEKRSSRRDRSRSRSSSRSFNGSPGESLGESPFKIAGSVNGQFPFVTPQKPPFEGLLYYDSIDSRGHPVVVVNTGALPRVPFGVTRARTAALNYMRDTLEPVVNQGPYVLIFTSFQVTSLSKVSATWVVSAYRKLSRPFKKNVKFIILVRPSLWLKALLKIMGMVVKKKARNKVKILRRLEDMAIATGGEVAKEHLSISVLKALEHTKDGLPLDS